MMLDCMTYVDTSYLFLKNGLAYKIILGKLTRQRTSILVIKKETAKQNSYERIHTTANKTLKTINVHRHTHTCHIYLHISPLFPPPHK